MPFEGLTSCAQLTSVHADEAVASADAFRTFLTWAASVARPEEGAPKLLMAIARLADADWVEGSPRTEIRGDDSATTVAVFSDHGMGVSERLAPPAQLAVPFEEFTRAVELAPQLLGDLQVLVEDAAISLTPLEDADEADAADSIRIDDRSLHEQERQTVTSFEPLDPLAPPSAPPTVRDPTGPHTRPTVRHLGAVRTEVLREAPKDGVDDD